MFQVQIGNNVHFNREDAYKFDGTVLALDEIRQRALVQWVDCIGQHRQMMVGVEFLTVTANQKAVAA